MSICKDSICGSHVEPFSLEGNRNTERSKSLVGGKNPRILNLDRAKKNQECVAVGTLRGSSIDSYGQNEDL